MEESKRRRVQNQPNAPQQLLASVSEGVQRLQQHLKSHPLVQQPICAPKLSFPKQPISESTRQASCPRTQVVVEDEGVLVALQARNNVHRAAVMLGAAMLHKMSRLGNKLKEHHSRMREEGELRKQARRAERGAEHHNPLKLAFPWQRKRRRGVHNENAIFRMGGPRAAADALIRKGKEHEREMDVRAAVKCYEDADKLVPNVVDTVCLAAKAWSDVCYLDEIFKERLSDQDKRDVNSKAIEYSKKAITLAPARALPHVACCISMGRLAVFSDNKAKVKLAKEAREQAVIALQKEPQNDLAHHLMGRWHWEMANLNGIVRTLIRLMYGTDLAPGTHLEALNHYRRASELNPNRLVHRVELGRSLAKMGEKEKALEQLEYAMTLDVEDINAHLQKVDAEILLKELQRSVRRSKQKNQPMLAQEGSGSDIPPGQLPWNWKLPQLSNPFQQRTADEQAPAAQQGVAVEGKQAAGPADAMSSDQGAAAKAGAIPNSMQSPKEAAPTKLDQATPPTAAARRAGSNSYLAKTEGTPSGMRQAAMGAASAADVSNGHAGEKGCWLPSWSHLPFPGLQQEQPQPKVTQQATKRESQPRVAAAQPLLPQGYEQPEPVRSSLPFGLDLARIRNPFEGFKRRSKPTGS